jgi:uncharacterized integral membrane protein
VAFSSASDDPPSGEQPRGGVDNRRAIRLLVAGIAVVAAVVFMAQNNEDVQLDFLVFDITARLWVGLLVTLLLGAILGQAVETMWDRRRRRRAGRD